MSNKALEAMNLALRNFSPNTMRIVLTADDELPNGSSAYGLSENFKISGVLTVIGKTKLVEIINSKKLNEANVDELINILTTNSKATVVIINANPISCKVFYPTPEIGTKHTNGYYQYSYGQMFFVQDGQLVNHRRIGGVSVLDRTQSDYISPLTMIQGKPVTNMAHLFYNSLATRLNLVDWDTSNITDMHCMFADSKSTSLDLSSFDASNVTDMNSMFNSSKVTSLDVSNFNTSKVTDMYSMFAYSKSKNIDNSNVWNEL